MCQNIELGLQVAGLVKYKIAKTYTWECLDKSVD